MYVRIIMVIFVLQIVITNIITEIWIYCNIAKKKLYKKSLKIPIWGRVRVMVFNATFNNISVISWRSVLLVEETGVPGENH